MSELHALARSIVDSDVFVAEIDAIAARYGREHEFDTKRSSVAATREALRRFSKHAGALAIWLENSAPVGMYPERPEHDARLQINNALGAGLQASFEELAGILVRLNAAVPAALDLVRKRVRTAPMIAADSLVQMLPRHDLRVTTWVSERADDSASAAVKLLVAIAKAAGDDISPLSAREYVKDAETRSRKKPAL